ncbi:twin-arginine translocase TatA/TatE family subunit [Pseudomonas sp. KCJK8521]|uniref:twin-arginine translocase TatA/TatE family subunit n=1 Tax=Pseudomonas sp. KCJK8521 TaxID=3344557 RepID=UPI003906BA4D
MGIFDWKHWIVLLVVVVLVFGTKKLKNFGGDLGESIKGFRKAMSEEESKPAEQPPLSAQPVSPMQATQQPTTAPHQGHIIEGQAQPVQEPQRKD